jgi:hypothetical protein
MTTAEIISGLETLNTEILAAKQATEKAGKNPSWLIVARGAVLKVIEQIGLHQKFVENAPAPVTPSGGPASQAPAQVSTSPRLSPAGEGKVAVETAALRGTK